MIHRPKCWNLRRNILYLKPRKSAIADKSLEGGFTFLNEGVTYRKDRDDSRTRTETSEKMDLGADACFAQAGPNLIRSQSEMSPRSDSRLLVSSFTKINCKHGNNNPAVINLNYNRCPAKSRCVLMNEVWVVSGWFCRKKVSKNKAKCS